MLNLNCALMDVETAFLHGVLEEEVYMECPRGLDHKEDEILKLNKTIYGLVQAARQFFKTWANVLQNLGFVQSDVDPCLFVKPGPVMLGTYVDDNYVLGNKDAMKATLHGCPAASYWSRASLYS